MRNEPHWGNRARWNDKPGNGLIPESVTDALFRPLAEHYANPANLALSVSLDLITQAQADELAANAQNWLEEHK